MAEISPSCCSIICLTLASPSPVPLCFVVIRGSNIFSIGLIVIPEPESFTLIIISDALAPGGRVVIEGHTAAAVERIGAGRRGEQRTWYTAGEGLFSPRPHLQLYEALWDAARRAATERYYIVDSETAEVTAHAQSMQAYGEAEYDALFLEAGLKIVERYGTPTGEAYDASADLAVMIAAPRS